MFGKKNSTEKFKRAAAKGMSFGITAGINAMIKEFNLDETKAQLTFIRAFESALAETVGEDPGFFAGRNDALKDLLSDD